MPETHGKAEGENWLHSAVISPHMCVLTRVCPHTSCTHTIMLTMSGVGVGRECVTRAFSLHLGLVPKEARRGHWIPWNWKDRQLGATPHVCAGNPTPLLLKRSHCSKLWLRLVVVTVVFYSKNAIKGKDFQVHGKQKLWPHKIFKSNHLTSEITYPSLV